MSLDQRIKETVAGFSNWLSRATSKELLEVTVRSRDKILFQGKVKGIISENKLGEFAILPEHANFITLIQNRILILKENGQSQEIKINNGLLKIWENKATIFLDILSPLSNES